METITTPEKPATRSKEYIASIITQWQQSGKNKKQFCQENNLTYMTFIGWTAPKKKKAKEKGPAFIPVAINKTLPAVFAEINLRDGAKVIFHSEVSAQYLRDILS